MCWHAGIVFEDDLPYLAKQAYITGASGPGKLWVFTDSVSDPARVVGTDADARAGVHGSANILGAGGTPGVPGWDELLTQWKASDQAALAAAGVSTKWNYAGATFTADTDLHNIAAFSYDAVISHALAACRLLEAGKSITGEAMLQEMIEHTDFEGVSGTVRFNELGSRHTDTATIIVNNVLAPPGGAWTSAEVDLPLVGSWTAGQWTYTSQFTYSDGTQAAPVEPNILNLAVFARHTVNDGVNEPERMSDSWLVVLGGALLAAQHFNDRNPVVISEFGGLEACQVKFDVSVVDTGSRARPAIGAYRNLRQTGRAPHVIVGAARSAVSTPLALIAGIDDTPQISYWSTAPALDDTSSYPMFMRTIPADNAVAPGIADLYKDEFHHEYLAILYVNDPYGQGYAEAAQSACNDAGIDVKQFTFNFNDADTIKGAVQKLAASGLHSFFAIIFDDDLEAVLDEAIEQGIVGPSYIWNFADAVSGSAISALTKPEHRAALHGSSRVYFTGALSGESLNALGLDASRYDIMLEEWMKMSDVEANALGFPDSFAMNSSVGADPASIPFFDITAYAYDAVAAAGLGACASGVNPTVGAELYASIRNQTFVGVSGSILLNEFGTRHSSTANVIMENILSDVEGSKPLTVTLKAGWSGLGAKPGSNGKWSYLEDMVYSGDEITPPTAVVVPEYNMNYVPSGIMTFGYALFFIDVSTAFTFFVWTIFHRNEKTVRYSQPMFLAMIALGSIISSAAIIPLATDDSVGEIASDDGGNAAADLSCMAAAYFYSFGFVLTFTPLFAKLWKVTKIVMNSSLKVVKVTAGQVALLVAGVGAVDVIILVVWSADSPLVYARHILESDQYGNPMRSVGLCESDGAMNYISAIVVVHTLLLVWGCQLAYKARNVGTAFSESKYITIAMVGNLQVLALAVPVLVMVADDPVSGFFLRAGVIFLNDFTVQCFIFIPKILAVHTDWFEAEAVADVRKSTQVTSSTSAHNQVAPNK